MNVASPELIEALIRADELTLMKLGNEPPIDPDECKRWEIHRHCLQANIEMFKQARALLP